MIRLLNVAGLLAIACLFAAVAPAVAAAPSQGASSTYASFVSGAQAQPGLFTVWHKDGAVYLELLKSQLDSDFMETITVGNGTGMGLFWGTPTTCRRKSCASNGTAIELRSCGRIGTLTSATARARCLPCRALSRSR